VYKRQSSYRYSRLYLYDLYISGYVNGDLIPSGTSQDIGSDSHRWDYGFFNTVDADTYISCGGDIFAAGSLWVYENLLVIGEIEDSLIPDSHKSYDVGSSGQAWDDMYADDFNNVADFYWLEKRRDEEGNIIQVDDLAIITGIKPTIEFDAKTGLAIIDDSSLPDWICSKNANGKKAIDPDGKPYLSLKMITSLTWGAIRQLDARIAALEG